MTLLQKIAFLSVILSLIFSPFSVFAGNQLIATIKGTGTGAQVYSVSTDHLTGSNVVTNSSGTVEELMDYYPYGDIRLDEKAGTFNEQRKFAGHEYDADTDLSYMNARYYNGKIGRFISQDPAHLLIGDLSFKDKYNRTLAMHLSDPQSLNSYSYVNNNPLKYTDPDGEIIPLLAAAVAVGWGAFEVGSTAYDGYVAVSTLLNKNASNVDKGLAVGAFGLGLGTVGPGNAYVKGGGKLIQGLDKTNDIETLKNIDYLSGVEIKSFGRNVYGSGVKVNVPIGNYLKDLDARKLEYRGLYENNPAKYGYGQKLPDQSYKEYTIPTPNATGNPQRFVVGNNGAVYYTPDHYNSFVQVKGGIK